MSKNTAIIENPLAFMVENYIKKKALQNEFSSTKIYMILKDELPHKIFLTFDSDELCSQFIEKYNQKCFDKNIDYKLNIVLNEKELNPELIKSEILKEEEKKNPYIFEFPYENEWWIDYVTNQEKPGLLYKNEEAKKKIYKTAKYLVTKMGKNILTGKSILNVSFPVFIFDKRTLHQAFCHEQRLAPYYLTRAVYSPDVLERLKWVTVHLLSFLHLTTTQVKPFNPIIGETFQCRIGNLKIYLEHTVNHPITANFYAIDDDKTYEMFGYQITDASVTPNTCMATRLGLYYVRIIKDNTLFRIRIPDALVRGITFGDRMFSYENKCLVIDVTNKLCSLLNDRQKKLQCLSQDYICMKNMNDKIHQEKNMYQRENDKLEDHILILTRQNESLSGEIDQVIKDDNQMKNILNRGDRMSTMLKTNCDVIYQMPQNSYENHNCYRYNNNHMSPNRSYNRMNLSESLKRQRCMSPNYTYTRLNNNF